MAEEAKAEGEWVSLAGKAVGMDEKARVDIAFEVGGELVRRKRGYGSELGTWCVCTMI